ncbi:GNAT family N-acetyltransferase [Microvirga sp. VF16]|uniref:GNAT family N-acetyltransferase n=1 Tax=Microvirga sp. VF16 TaxID=2807101 RepID=UPI00193D06D9|nr:GNAT family N-acetyltransferase [Microvirga sp. VF16]QRM29142.1 GNAT family N-acetyltransferase [Microvirga sp. VF16]
MTPELRPATPTDVEACGCIIFEAFKAIADQHGFPWDFPSVEAGTQLASTFIAAPTIYGVVAELDSRVVGSVFMAEGDPIRGIGPITVDPAMQGSGVGRKLMEAVLERARDALGVRLVQDAFNTRSLALYASLGFDVREPLVLMRGTPRSGPDLGFAVRPMIPGDVDACAELCTAVHDIGRSHELQEALQVFTPFVVEREGRITGYLSAATFWLMNHGVAETELDMRALLAGAGAMSAEPLSLLLPTRQANLFRWCLHQGMSVIKPMNLMTIGTYQEPKGCYFPSVLY